MYNVKLAIDAQRMYCEETKSPHFAPYDGYCYSCGKQIYSPTETKHGYTVGITVEQATNYLVTSCPYCNASYCD